MPDYPIKNSFVLAVKEGKKTVHKPYGIADGSIELTRSQAKPLIKKGAIGVAAEEPQETE